ncbi:oligosaccharide flippase family protein [Maribellus maritimus]|uniref:oligosaccharide flippase family protein n=1 Tax=Maribellus maritimus TaxID=2870838 RepID=UPI001EEAFF53|nr:oligosaccharide flippase family protein [Maribellus maritimus]MCG6188447.1 oligosaccharide flippase family protein [Maribellus maritimus]
MGEISEKKSYRQIFKATTIFGGVQIISVLINLLKSKIIAIFLGPEGMGIFYLLQNPIKLISQVSGLGINISGIREVSKSTNEHDIDEQTKSIITVRRWTRVSGLIGTVLTIILSSSLSKWSFGNTDYTWSFCLLSVVVLLTALGNENDVILKGTRQINNIARAGIYSAASSLAVTFPLYYFFKLQGIIPVLISTALFVYVFNRNYSRKVPLGRASLSYTETFQRGKKMASLGIMLVIAGFAETLAMYLVNIFIRNAGNIEDVGLFQAGMQITNVSISLVYTAMAGDYFPRLSAICHRTGEMNKLVNQQAVIAALISTPILMMMITFVSLLIQVFLSKSFLPVSNFIHWILLAAVFRASTWTIHYIILAKGDSKLFLKLVLLTNSLQLMFYIGGYKVYGLMGLGLGYLVTMTSNAAFMYYIIHRKYHFSFKREFIQLLTFGFIMTAMCIISGFVFNDLYKYITNSFIIVITIIISIRKLNQKIDLLDILKQYKKNK